MVRATMTEAPTATIAGGFLLLDVRQVLATWHTCKAPTLGIGAFRAYLAAREMVARRRAIGEGRAPAYSAAELARLLGLTERRARALVRHLVAAGLVSWADDAIAFPDPPEVSEGEPLDAIGGGRGDLAIPRRMLRFLARGATAATIATALGVLLRCLSRRRQGFDGRGRVKASWIAGTFGVDLRRVKASRAGLVALGWIVPEPGDQWSANRWGRAFRVALDWRAPASPRIAEACNVSQQFVGLVQHRHYNRCNVGVDTSIEGKDGNAYPQPCAPPPPLRPESGASSPPPCLDRDPLPGGERNQEPASGRPAGLEVGQGGDGEQSRHFVADLPRGRTDAKATTLPADLPEVTRTPPRLDDVRPEDLADVGRTLALLKQAVARGIVGGSEADRLRFLAAAEHAKAVGKGNPPGLFAAIVRKGWWSHLTQADEDRAACKLRDHERGVVRPRPRPVPRHPDLAQAPAPPSSLGGVMSRLAARFGGPP